LKGKILFGIATAIMLLTATLPLISMAQTGTKVLQIVPKKQTKDTYLLCVGQKHSALNQTSGEIYYFYTGCPLKGIEAWDIPHAGNDEHGRNYCVRACISMIAANLSQDRITYYIKEEKEGPIKDGQPENDLWHGAGFIDEETTAAFSWALNGASITFIQAKPTFSEIKQWIDEGRPIIRAHRVDPKTQHATVLNGYEVNGEKVHIIDPLTAIETIESYATLSVDKVWVPPANATARSDEPDIWLDSDHDGVMDFDEQVRFKTDPNNSDTDKDKIPDKIEIRSYVFLSNDTFDTWDVRKPDMDNDGLRAELDPDTDGGGCPDGLEDKNFNGKLNAGETDVYNASDDPVIPKPVAIFENLPEKPWVNETILFNATKSYSPNGNITYEWSFDSENITTIEPMINHTFLSPGNHTIVLKVTDELSMWNTTSKKLTIYYITDVNKDRTVNILDISLVAKAYGSKPGDPKWNAIADFDKNGIINIIDISKVAKDYGKTT